MRILNALCGIAVLFTSLAYAHILHHHFIHSPQDSFRSPIFWLAILLALAAGILSFIGAFLLLKFSTNPK